MGILICTVADLISLATYLVVVVLLLVLCESAPIHEPVPRI